MRDLAGIFRTRIELRQIGVRDEAKLKGGVGICGREYCCATILSNFVSVALRMAKDQQLPLNPAKLSGPCGRLRCCLAFEHAAYREALARHAQRGNSEVVWDGRTGRARKLDPLRELVTVQLAGPSRGRRGGRWPPGRPVDFENAVAPGDNAARGRGGVPGDAAGAAGRAETKDGDS